MLKLHKLAWEAHPKDTAYYTVIDDGSPVRVPLDFRLHNLDIYRIDEDIPWNIAGARNLAFHVAKTEWVLCADIDHIVTTESLLRILDLDFGNHNTAYIFNRKTDDGYYGCRAIINVLMSRQRYFEIGGHDEDYSGHYGREETFFSRCLRYHKVRIVYCDDIVLDWRPRIGSTTGLVRNKTHNAKIFDDKCQALENGTYINDSLLRFEWRCVT
jgi:hypothetical protein